MWYARDVSGVEDDRTTQLQRRSAITQAPAGVYRIIVTQGPDAGGRVEIDASHAGQLLVGKSPACGLILTDPLASRRHVGFEVVRDGLRMEDLGSTNGTFIGGLRVGSAVLAGGETVKLANTTLTVERASDRAAPSLIPNAQLGLLIGVSREMRRLYPLLERLAESTVPVLIEGETGTGKEIVAETIHRLSPRSEGPFIVFDCASVAPNLVEIELFGHEEGVGGSPGPRRGLFEQADGGTLLIDEIADLDPSVQPKLLRVLERGEIRRVGGNQPIPVNVRVLSATRRDLDVEVQEGRFRDDLFHRLVVARVELPPLRARRGDVAVLARNFARQLAGPEATIPDPMIARWDRQPWPGNVRQLRNAVARHLAIGDLALDLDAEGVDDVEDNAAFDDEEAGAQPPAEITPDRRLVEQVLDMGLPLVEARQKLVEEFDRAYLARVLGEHKGNVTRAAAASGLARRNFQLLRARRGI